MGAAARIEVLGDVRVLAPSGDALPVGGVIARTILAILVARRDRPSSADWIIDNVWPDPSTAPSRSNVRLHVSRLRKSISSGGSFDPIPSTESGYRLDTDVLAVDANDLAVAVELHRVATSPAFDDRLDAAVRSWHGVPFSNTLDIEILRVEATRLTSQHHEAMVLWSEMAAAHRRSAETIDLLHAGLDTHPYSEAIATRLVTGLYASGRHREALAAHRVFTERIRDDLGLDPSPTFTALERDILTHEVGEATAPPSAPSAPEPVSPPFVDHRLASLVDPPCVGRDATIDTIVAKIQDGERGVLISGPPGIGKTWLLGEFARRLGAVGISTASGTCNQEGGVALQAWNSVLREIRKRSGHDLFDGLSPTITRLLGSIDPGYWRDGHLHDGVGIETLALRGAVAELLEQVARTRPIVVALDDVQWADEHTASLTRYVLEASIDNLAVVATTRPPDDTRPTAIAEHFAERHTVVRLDGLGLHGTKELLGHRQATIDDDLAHRLHTWSAGSPLQLQQVDIQTARAFIEELIDPRSGLEAAVDVRLRTLPDRTLQPLGRAAVCGIGFDLELLVDLMDRDVDDVLDALEPAVRRGIVEVDADQPNLFRFTHVLYHRWCHALVADPIRQRLHARIATLGGGSDDDVLRRAWHSIEAGERLSPESRLPIGLAAAGVLARRGASEQLSDLATRLLESIPADGPFAEDLDEVRLHRARAEALMGRWDASSATSRQLFDDALERGSVELAARVALEVDDAGRNVRLVGDRHRMLRDARAALHAHRPSTIEVEVTAELVAEANQFGRGTDAAGTRRLGRLAEENLVEARRIGDQRALSAALFAASSSTSWRPHAESRLAMVSESVRIAEDLGDLHRLHHGLGTLVRIHLQLGDLVGALDAAHRHDELARATRHPRVVWFSMLRAASLAQMRGRFDDARQRLNEMFEYGAAFELPDNEGGYGAALFFDLYHADQLASAREVVERQAAAEHHNPLWRLGAAQAQVAAGDRAVARYTVSGLIDGLHSIPRNEFWCAVLCIAAEAATRAGCDADRLAVLRRELGPWTGKFAVLGMMIATLGPVDRYLALLDEGLGSSPELLRARAGALAQRLGATAWIARIERDAAEPDPT